MVLETLFKIWIIFRIKIEMFQMQNILHSLPQSDHEPPGGI